MKEQLAGDTIMIETIKLQISNSIKAKQLALQNEELISKIKKVAERIISSLGENKKVLIAGNGGSAADAQHIAGEFVSKLSFDRAPLPSIAITTDTSIITAIGNDYGYEKLFERQILALGNRGDVFIAISTSGNSKNIIKALEVAKSKGIFCVGFTGEKQCLMDDFCDIVLKVPSIETPRIQESHIMYGHIICDLVESAIFKK